jgi:hypothetical protein
LKIVNATNNNKFIRLTSDNTLNWKTHSDLTLLKLNKAFCTIRGLKHTLTQDTLIMIYFAYFHSILNHSITFWGSSRYSNKILILQIMVLKTITGLGNQDSRHEQHRNLHILSLTSLYIYTHTHRILCFVILNRDEFALVSETHRIFTRQVAKCYQPMSKTTLYQIQVLHNKLPPFIKYI